MHPSRRAFVEDGNDEPRTVALEDVPEDEENYALTSGSTGIAPEMKAAILSQLNRKRVAAQIPVPTNDNTVRARLRELGEPITLFAESFADRRDRLRELLTTIHLANGGSAEDFEPKHAPGPGPGPGPAERAERGERGERAEGEGEDEEDGQEEEFYTSGGDRLLSARIDIAEFSLPRAKRRIAFQKDESAIPLRTHMKFRKQIKERLQAFELQGSQNVGERNISLARISPSGTLAAVGNWGGTIKLVDIPTLAEKGTLRGHTGTVGGISWAPGATSGAVSADCLNLASGGAEGNVHLWSLNKDTPLATLSGHAQRVCRVEFHPMGRYLASASEDTTWRLWDVETQTEVLLQEGHSRGVYAVSFSVDGSLLASAGLDSIGRVWDLRSGRTVMILDEHIKPIYGLDWGSDGHRLLTGSADGWVKCWDLRKVERTGAIGAHTSVVSDLRWFKGTDGPAHVAAPGLDSSGAHIPPKAGTFLVTAGFDRQVKIFSADDWSLIQTLSGHNGPVTCVDVSADARWIISGSHDRTLKLWGRGDGQGI